MYNDSFRLMSDIVKTSLTSISKLQAESIKASINYLSDSMEELTEVISDCCSSEHLNTVTEQLSDLIQTTISNIELPQIPSSAFSFLDELNFQNEYIELTEDECDSINTLLNLTGAEKPAEVIPNSKTPSTQFVLSILVPIIIGFLQLWQNEVHYKLDSIERQKAQIEEQEYHEQILKNLSDIIDSLNEIQESQESCPCSHFDAPVPQDEASTDIPDVQSQDDSAE